MVFRVTRSEPNQTPMDEFFIKTPMSCKYRQEWGITCKEMGFICTVQL